MRLFVTISIFYWIAKMSKRQPLGVDEASRADARYLVSGRAERDIKLDAFVN